MGVFDDIPAWARLPAQPLAHTAAQTTGQDPPKKRGRPKGAKDSKPRAKIAPTDTRPTKEPHGNPP
jgi:hypothetical protein